MRSVTPRGIFLRALLGAVLTLAVLAASVALVAGWTGAIFALLRYDGTGLPNWAAGVKFGAVVSLPVFGWTIRKTIRKERFRLLNGTVDPSEVELEAAASLDPMIQRLAMQFDTVPPEVRVYPDETPLAYSTLRSEDPLLWVGESVTPVVVVSTGLISSLPRDELEAVLAHELAHHVNDDFRLTSWLLVTLVGAETLQEQMDHRRNEFDFLGDVLAALASIGVGIFSRGREFAADRGAAVVTGDPESLAAALEQLDDSTSYEPTTDLRTHARSTNAINILPALDPKRGGGSGLRATHPPIEARIEQLRSLARTEISSRNTE